MPNRRRIQTFSDRLRIAMGELTQMEFVARLEIAQPQLARYLGGQVPDAPMLTKIAKVTGYSIDWLLTGHDLKDNLRTAVQKLRSLPSQHGKPWADTRGKAEAEVSQVNEVIDILQPLLAAESAPIYAATGDDARLVANILERLPEEERAALRRCAEALNSEDDQVRQHLIGQMKLVERAMHTRRKETRAKREGSIG